LVLPAQPRLALLAGGQEAWTPLRRANSWHHAAGFGEQREGCIDSMTRTLVTGAAGFIGFHLTHRLLAEGEEVFGIDNLNNYYDVRLKQSRLDILQKLPGFRFAQVDVADAAAVAELFARERPQRVAHLAAQPGVRYGISHPHAYIDANVSGFLTVLEGCRHTGVDHLVFASSSSVYGANTRVPYSVHDPADHPLSLYAASKKANELMAHSYAHLFGIPCTGLRFFTVYGPWGRPDMALSRFTAAILAGTPIDVYNFGRHRRDFTYVDDIVEGVVRVLNRPAQPEPTWDGVDPDPATSQAPYRLYDIGNNQPVALLELIETLETALGREAEKRMLPKQPGDVEETWADVSALQRDVGFAPSTSIVEGIARFVAWYREYHAV
jgi:UDP-glucuronate 4-epimerase